MCLCTLHNYVKFVCVHCTIAVFCRTFNSKTVVFAFHCWMGRTVRWLQIIISFNLVELTFIPYHFHIEIISLLKVKSNGFFVFWMLEGSIGRFKAFKPLTLFLLRGGVNFTPHCSFILHNSKSIGLRLLTFSDFS